MRKNRPSCGGTFLYLWFLRIFSRTPKILCSLSSFAIGGFSSWESPCRPVPGLVERCPRAFDNNIAEIPMISVLTTIVVRTAFFIFISPLLNKLL
jgi:hypothetical protein